MSDKEPSSLEDKLKAVAAEIVRLEAEITEVLKEHDGLLKVGSPIPTVGRYSQKTLDELYKKLNNARQAQLSYLLASVGESSNRLETVTKNLKESSDSQVKTTQRLKESSDFQVKTTKRLLKSSMSLETFTLYLIVVALANIVVVIAQASGTKWSSTQLGLMAVAVFVALAAAGIYSRVQAREAKKLDKSEP